MPVFIRGHAKTTN
uniref:Uncharacterized protein n=1 Tax=Anguilla anguilla TaxID=7936 RepID=A0A0E9TBU6_ANGAN